MLEVFWCMAQLVFIDYLVFYVILHIVTRTMSQLFAVVGESLIGFPINTYHGLADQIVPSARNVSKLFLDLTYISVKV